MSQEAIWFYSLDGYTKMGPVTQSEMLDKIALRGASAGKCYVWQPEFEDWMFAEDVRCLNLSSTTSPHNLPESSSDQVNQPSHSPYTANTYGSAKASGRAINGPRGIGGWLILPAIGLCISPPLNILGIVSLQSLPLIALYEDYPGLANLIRFQTGIGVISIVYVIVTAILFFKQHPVVPKMIVFYLLIGCLLALVNAMWTSSVFGEFDSTDFGGMAKPFVSAMVWVPYFCVSKRVKNTFV